jgi:hypothetical protein
MERRGQAQGVVLVRSPLDLVLEALAGAGCGYRRIGRSWQARCPVHDDRTPSLSIREGADGRVLLHCFAGCETGAVLEALGLQFSDLFPQSRGRRRGGMSLS